MNGVRVLESHPQNAQVSCEECKTHRYHPDWTPNVVRKGTPYELHLRRLPGESLPCHKCPKIPKGVNPKPENARYFRERQWKIYLHYKECQISGRWPDDPWVLFHAFLISQVEESLRTGKALAILENIQGLLTSSR